MIVKAKLIKRMTEDGNVEVEDDVPIGKVYLVDLTTKQMVKGFNVVRQKSWEREMIQIADEDGGLFPTELLEICKL